MKFGAGTYVEEGT